MSKRKDLTGMKFNRLEVLGYVGDRYYICRCECGNEKRVFSSNLTTGQVKSCGCLRDEQTRRSNSIHHDATRTHGKKRLWSIWAGMRKRCSDINEKNYGGRGISVCNEWLDYQTFKIWALENGYNDELQIDRVDTNGNYEPSNCRWATPKVQSNNRRNNRHIQHDGCRRTISEWSEITGIKSATIWARINVLGWEESRALTEDTHSY